MTANSAFGNGGKCVPRICRCAFHVVLALFATFGFASVSVAEPAPETGDNPQSNAASELNLSERNAAAQALFEQAKALVAQGKVEQACPKFEESQRLDPGVGTQFNLADCYERTGRLASAYTTFMDVAAATRQLGQVDREVVARERASAIKPRL